jgi:hypothetical protein
LECYWNKIWSSSMMTNTEEREKREKTCKECPSNFMNVCRRCGCFIVIKVRVKDAECPAGKWDIND